MREYKFRATDESVREGRHLTPEERIALQAEEIKQLWQENEQLRAFVPQKGEIIVDAEQLRQLQAQMGALKAAKESELEIELARYKQEAEKIPQMCHRNRLNACQVCSQCPAICPKYEGGGRE